MNFYRSFFFSFIVLFETTREVPKHNVLIIGGDFNAHVGQQDAYYQQTKWKWSKDERLLTNKLSCIFKHKLTKKNRSTLAVTVSKLNLTIYWLTENGETLTQKFPSSQQLSQSVQIIVLFQPFTISWYWTGKDHK